MKEHSNSISLACGRVVHVDAFSVEQTYAGMLCGVPDKEMNDEIIAAALLNEEWGERKTHLIDPVIIPRECGTPVLPPCLCKAWLVCHDKNKGGDGSELVVVWFAYAVFDHSLDAVISNAVVDLPWDELAVAFEL
jgi:hypothetical protein